MPWAMAQVERCANLLSGVSQHSPASALTFPTAA